MNELTVMLYTYNRAEYLRKCIYCILQSTYRDFTLTILDNASEDHTQEVVKGFRDDRIIYLNNGTNIGRETITRGVRECKTKFIYWMCDDDFIKPTAIERMMVVMKKYSDVKAVGIGYGWVDMEGNPIDSEEGFLESDIYYRKYDYLMQNKFLVNSTTILDMDYIREQNIQYDRMNHDSFYTEKIALSGAEIYLIGEKLADRTSDPKAMHLLDLNDRNGWECYMEHALNCMETITGIKEAPFIKKKKIMMLKQRTIFLKGYVSLLERDIWDSELLLKDFGYRMRADWIPYGSILEDQRMEVYFKLFPEFTFNAVRTFQGKDRIYRSEYIKSWEKLIMGRDKAAENLGNYNKIALYGFSFNAKLIYLYLKAIKIRVEMVLDKNAGRKNMGISVRKPEEEVLSQLDLVIISAESDGTIVSMSQNLIENHYNGEFMTWDCLV